MVTARSDVETLVLRPWIEAVKVANFGELIRLLNGDGGEASTAQAWKAAPFKLVSIGYRPDLLRGNFLTKQIESGGEGRFIFQAVNPQGQPLGFTIIFEYELPAVNLAQAGGWARKYRELLSLTPGSADFNSKLAAITVGFTDRDFRLGRPNNVALSQLRTNELIGRPSASNQWELREFRITNGGRLEPAAVQMTPDLRFDSSDRQVLIDYLMGTEFEKSFPNTTVPWVTQSGRAFLAGNSITPGAFISLETPLKATSPKVDTWLTGQATGEDNP